MQLHKIEMTTATECLNLLPMVDELNKQQDFASRLKAEMSRKGLTVRELSLACDVTYEMARRYTLGTAKPREEKLAKIAGWLEVSPAWLEYGSPGSSTTEGTESPAAALQAQDMSQPMGIDDFTNLSDDEKRLLRIFRQYPYIEARNMLMAFEARFQQLNEHFRKK